MHAVIFHGGSQNDADLESIHTQLCNAMQARGWTVDTKRLETMKIRPCTGCFGCWLRTPGECLQADDGREIPRAFVKSDAVIFVTPVSFGGYSGLLKTAYDRIIPYVSPLFKIVNGEMHHRKRYPHTPMFFTVGWQQHSDPEAAEIFEQLTRRNALNLEPPVYGSLVLNAAQTAEEWQAQIAQLAKKMEVTK